LPALGAHNVLLLYGTPRQGDALVCSTTASVVDKAGRAWKSPPEQIRTQPVLSSYFGVNETAARSSGKRNRL